MRQGRPTVLRGPTSTSSGTSQSQAFNLVIDVGGTRNAPRRSERLPHGYLALNVSQQDLVTISILPDGTRHEAAPRYSRAAVSQTITDMIRNLGFADLLEESVSPEPHPTAWGRSTERLIRQVELLLDQRETLVERLTKALNDYDAAEARVRQLEKVVEALQLERSSTGRPKMEVMSWYAQIIGTLLALALAVGSRADAEDDHSDPIEITVNIANEVIADCGGTPVEVVMQPPSAPPMSVSATLPETS